MGTCVQSELASLLDAESEIYSQAVGNSSGITNLNIESPYVPTQFTQDPEKEFYNEIDGVIKQNGVDHNNASNFNANDEILKNRNSYNSLDKAVYGVCMRQNQFESQKPLQENVSSFIHSVDTVKRDFEEYLKNEPLNSFDCEVNGNNTAEYNMPKSPDKNKTSFRLSILNLLNKSNQIDLSHYYELNKNKKAFLYPDESDLDFHNTNYLHETQTYTGPASDEQQPLTSIISNYLRKIPFYTNDNHNIYPLSHDPPSHSPQSILTKISVPTDHFRNEVPVSKSIITPPPSDLALNGFKTTSSDSVLSNQIFDYKSNGTNNYNFGSYHRSTKFCNYTLQDRSVSTKIVPINYFPVNKSSFDPISALDEVLMLQNEDRSNIKYDESIMKYNSSNTNSEYEHPYSIKNVTKTSEADNSNILKNHRKYNPPETHYDQKSTLMLTDLAHNLNRLSIVESPDNENPNTNYQPYRCLNRPPEQVGEKDINHHVKWDKEEYPNDNLLDPNKKQNPTPVNVTDINNSSIEEKVIQNLKKKYISEDQSDDEEFSKSEYANSVGVGKLYERQYRLAVAEKMAIDKKNTLNSRENKFVGPSEITWGEYEKEQNPRHLKNNFCETMPQMMEGCQNNAKYLRKARSNRLLPIKKHTKDYPLSNLEPRLHENANLWINNQSKPILEVPEIQENPEISCNCPRVLKKMTRDRNIDDCINYSAKNDSSKSKMQNIDHYAPSKNETRKFGIRRSGSAKSFRSDDKNSIAQSVRETSSGSMHMVCNTSKSSPNFFSKFLKIKKLFTSNKHPSKTSSKEQVRVMHNPHCTLTRSSSISKESLPIIPSPRSISFSNPPLQCILKSQSNNNISSNKRINNNDSYFNVNNSMESCDNFFDNYYRHQNNFNARSVTKPNIPGTNCNYVNPAHANFTKNKHEWLNNNYQGFHNSPNKLVPHVQLSERPKNSHLQYPPQPSNSSPIPVTSHSKQKHPQQFSASPCPPPRRRLSFLTHSPRRCVHPAHENRALPQITPNNELKLMSSVCNNRRYAKQVVNPQLNDQQWTLLMETPSKLELNKMNRKINFNSPPQPNERDRSRTYATKARIYNERRGDPIPGDRYLDRHRPYNRPAPLK